MRSSIMKYKLLAITGLSIAALAITAAVQAAPNSQPAVEPTPATQAVIQPQEPATVQAEEPTVTPPADEPEPAVAPEPTVTVPVPATEPESEPTIEQQAEVLKYEDYHSTVTSGLGN
jgi:outer membrane biosynthesis protein TonB